MAEPVAALSLQVGISLQRMADSSVRTGIKLRSALMSEIFRKTFRLSAQHTKVRYMLVLVGKN